MKSILSFLGVLVSMSLWAQTQVTFQVDMTGQTVSPNGVHVAGSFQGWSPSSSPMTSQGNGLYSLTVTLAAGTFQYKFINGNDWPQAEVVPAGCGIGDGFGGYNRSIDVAGMNPITTTAFCFGTCNACNAQPSGVTVTLVVDMTDQLVGPNGVHVAGSFQGWNPSSTAMTSIGNGQYAHSFEWTENTSFNYKFINGNDWPQAETVPAECGVGDGFGGYNRNFIPLDSDTSSLAVCFASCAPCATLPDPEMVHVSLRVDMSQETVDPNGVHVVGSFQNWTLPGANMVLIGNGVYEYSFEATEDAIVDYRFLNGIDYAGGESVPSECGVDDGFGGINRQITLTGLNDTVVSTVCFGSCNACVVEETVLTTFHVDMSQETVSPQGVHLAGSFNDWSSSATPMTDLDADNVYTAEVALPANAQVFYKFINGDTWPNEETLPSECSLSDGFGNFNRVIYTSLNDTVLPQVCFAACLDCGVIIEEPSNVITFKVNMSQEVVSPNGVHIAGNFNGWNPASDELTDVNSDGVYEVSLTLDEWSNISFKFINGNDFNGAEVVPSGCGLPDGVGGNNRLLETGGQDVSFGPVCFSTCDICEPINPPNMVNVTLKVNMQNETVSPNGVHVAGNFQGWDPSATEMTDEDADGIYEYTFEAEVASQVQFKFINGNAWVDNETVPSLCDEDNDLNRSIDIGAEDVVFGPVCFGACEDCGVIVEPTLVTVVFQVNMSNTVVSANGVHIAGSFQGWNPNGTVMSDLGGGIYELSYQVESNQTIQFKFINGSTWDEQEVVPAECGTDNGFGGFNRALEIGSENVVFGPVCFSGCADCDDIVEPTTVNVTFKVDMSNQAVSPNGVHVAGNFQGWNPATTEMTDINSDGIYEYTAAVAVNSNVLFKFINDNAWTGGETVPADCGEGDGFGGYNRAFNVLTNDTVFGPVCFSTCAACGSGTPVLLTLRVNMANETVSADGVYVAGDFNGWDATATQMSQFAPDQFEAVVVVLAGENVEYKFINGMDWTGAESVPTECGSDDGSGNINRSYLAGETNETLPIVCFGGCVDCISVPEIDITFEVNMSEQTIDPAGVFVAGSFNGFDPVANEMNQIGASTYSYTITVPTNTLITYKFLNGAVWETVPFECGQDDGFGGFNRTIQGGTTDINIPVVCFNECADCDISVEEAMQSKMVVYPNPTIDRVTIAGLRVGVPVYIWNAQGKLISVTSFDASQVQLDWSQYANGMYTIQQGSYQKRVIKE